MSRQISMKLIPALLLGVFSGAVGASGFQLLEQGSGLGNAYAGSAAKSNDASTIFWNPAGMTQLGPRAVSGGLTAVKASFKFDDKGSQVGEFGPGGRMGAGDGGDAGNWGYIPNGYLSWALTPNLYVGLGIGAPFGLKTKYDEPWRGSAQSNEFDIKTMNINPSIAFKVNDMVSLGAGVSWQKIEADYYRRVAINSSPRFGALPQVTSHMSIDDDAWGWNVGAVYALAGDQGRSVVPLDHPVSYRGQGEAERRRYAGGQRHGGCAQQCRWREQRQGRPQGAGHLHPERDAEAERSLGTAWATSPGRGGVRSRMSTSIAPRDSRAAHSRRLSMRTSRTRTALPWVRRIPFPRRSRLQFGLAYDQTPVKNSTSRLTSLPDNDRTWFTFGTQWKPAKEQTLELGLAYLYISDTKINKNETTANPLTNRGTVIGDYDSSVWILGAQYSLAF
jgi:long-chain fatty acid transport protein